MALYGFGDAQIDAQNRATDQIGAIKAQYNNLKAANQLTAAIITSTKSQIQAVIDTYNAAWGNTTRGAAGTRTLQSFVDSQIYPELDQDLQNVSQASTPSYSLLSPIALPSYTPSAALPTNINISVPGSSSTPTAMSPSQTPGPPSGIEIPGTSVNVTASDWMRNPLLWAGIGLLGYFAMRER